MKLHEIEHLESWSCSILWHILWEQINWRIQHWNSFACRAYFTWTAFLAYQGNPIMHFCFQAMAEVKGIPLKRRRSEIDIKKCIICQIETNKSTCSNAQARMKILRDGHN